MVSGGSVLWVNAVFDLEKAIFKETPKNCWCCIPLYKSHFSPFCSFRFFSGLFLHNPQNGEIYSHIFPYSHDISPYSTIQRIPIASPLETQPRAVAGEASGSMPGMSGLSKDGTKAFHRVRIPWWLENSCTKWRCHEIYEDLIGGLEHEWIMTFHSVGNV